MTCEYCKSSQRLHTGTRQPLSDNVPNCGASLPSQTMSDDYVNRLMDLQQQQMWPSSIGLQSLNHPLANYNQWNQQSVGSMASLSNLSTEEWLTRLLTGKV